MSAAGQNPISIFIKAKLNSKIAPNLDFVHECFIPELEQEFDLDKTDHVVLKNARLDFDPSRNFLTITGQVLCVSTNNNNKQFVDRLYAVKDFQPLYIAQSDEFDIVVIENGCDIFICA